MAEGSKNKIPTNKVEGKKNTPERNNNVPYSLKLFFFRNGFCKYVILYPSGKFTLPAGFEPAAHCLEGSCSIQLS